MAERFNLDPESDPMSTGTAPTPHRWWSAEVTAIVAVGAWLLLALLALVTAPASETPRP